MRLIIKEGASLTRALNSPINDRIRQLLRLRCEQLGCNLSPVNFAVVEIGDTSADLEQTTGLALFGTQAFAPDWVLDHGFAFEAVFDLTEDFTQVVIIPNEQGIVTELLNFCKTYASEHA